MRMMVRIANRAPAPTDDEEGELLVQAVRSAVGAGRGWAAGVAVRERRTELLDLRGLTTGSPPGGPPASMPLPRFLAALTRSTVEDHGAPAAVGLAGRFLLRRGRANTPIGLVFLEWPDCRWWHWQVILDAGGREVPDSAVVRRAVDGDPLPDGLGRWWTLGRRLRGEVRLTPAPAREVPASPLVH